MQLLSHFLPDTISDQLLLARGEIEGDYSPEILTHPETDEWNGFKDADRRQEYLATRWLIRQMVQHLKLSPEDFSLHKDELGKPYGTCQGAEYHISIAHTSRQVICGISEGMELGVDVEPMKRRVPDRLRERILNQAEQVLLAEEQTIRIWTLKEALVKLQGTGMRTNLHDCTINAADGAIFSATFNNDNRAKICSFTHHKNWFAVAWNC